MQKKKWINLVMVILVSGLFLTMSCAVKKSVVSEPTSTEDQIEEENALTEQKKKEEQMKKEEQIKKEEQEQAVEAKKDFAIQDIYFEFDSSKLTSMAKAVLKEKAGWLEKNSSTYVIIEGHCDERGTTEYNLALGERRANAAKSYLKNLAISTSRLNTISYGEERPIDSDKNESAYQKNRRVHFVIE